MRALALLCLIACAGGEPARLGVGAAAIMRHAMPELVARHREVTGVQIDVVYGASDKLASGATSTSLDVLVLADPRIVLDTSTVPRVIATTSLVLIGPAGAPYRFSNLREEGVIAIGDPDTVPAGRYARGYLETLGIWDAVAPRVMLAGDVAGALSLAERGTVHAAVVYATDAQHAAPLVVLDRAVNGPVVKIAATVTGKSPHRTAGERFLDFVASAEARAILARHGFDAP